MEPRNYEAGAFDTPPSPVAEPSSGYPGSGNPATGTPATVPGPYWFHSITEEMRNVILLAGLTPDYNDLTQFSQAINALISQNLLPVGTVLLRSGDVVPNGFFKRNGAEVSRSTYASHWAYVQTVSNLIDQATKDSSPEIYAGYYGTGDGSTTYTLPDDRGEFHRVWDDGRGIDAGRAVGSFQQDQMQRITGFLDYGGPAEADRQFLAENNDRLTTNGVFKVTQTQNGNAWTGSISVTIPKRLEFDSGDSPSARVSSATDGQTYPRSVALMAIEKY